MTEEKPKQAKDTASPPAKQDKPAADKPGTPTKQEKTATDKAAKPAQPAKAKKPTSPLYSVFVLFAALLVGTLAGGYWLYQQSNERQTDQQFQLQRLQSQLDEVQQASKSLFGQLQQKLDDQQQAQRELQESLSTLLKRNDHLRKDWLLGEAEYLLKLASYRLLLERDVLTAVHAMQAADDRLRDVADPAVLTVRKALAEDRNALQSVAQPDISGMSLTLSALVKGIDKLPLKTPTPTVHSQQQQQVPARKIEDWKELPKAIWEDLKTLVTIRHHDEGIAALLSPKEHFYLSQNLQLQLEQARLALLLAKKGVYQERLQTSIQWLQQFFDPQNAAVQNAIATLQQLASIDIEPPLPDISNSYKTLQRYSKDKTAPSEPPTPVKAEPDTKAVPAAPEETPATPEAKTEDSGAIQ